MLAMCVIAMVPGVLLFAQRDASAASSITDALMLASPATGMWSLTEPKPWIGQTIHIEPVEWLGISLLVLVAAVAWAIVYARKARVFAQPLESSGGKTVVNPGDKLH